MPVPQLAAAPAQTTTVKRLVIIALATCAVLYATVVGFMYFAQRKLLYPGATGETMDTSQPPPWGQWQKIQTADGETLTALYQSPAPGRPIALFFHGSGERMLPYGFMAQHLAQRGIGLLAVAFRGYPGSTGSPTEARLLEDGRAAYHAAQRLAPDAPVAIIGYSLGTGIAVNTAAEKGGIALVLLAPYDSLAETAAGLHPYLPVRVLIKDPMRSDPRISAAQMPKLFIHGDQDDIIPIERGRALFAAAREPKQFVAIPGEGHGI